MSPVPDDAVPEADRQEQATPAEPDPRLAHPHPDDEPEADVLEQEVPVGEDEEVPTGLDEDRVEPVDEGDRPAD